MLLHEFIDNIVLSRERHKTLKPWFSQVLWSNEKFKKNLKILNVGHITT